MPIVDEAAFAAHLGTYLLEETGKTAVDWIAFVQSEIPKHSKPYNENHDITDTAKVWEAVVAEVIASAPEDPDLYDENLRTARLSALVMSLWFSACSRSKTRDPRRPIALRREAHHKIVTWRAMMLQAMTDDAFDPFGFPSQKFENPFAPDATDGDFV